MNGIKGIGSLFLLIILKIKPNNPPKNDEIIIQNKVPQNPKYTPTGIINRTSPSPSPSFFLKRA
jgi:hypothetical protein